MKKFYCLYNRNNLPFSWKLKQANEKPIANFKSREDCLNYYLSLNNVGIIWFQKASSKATRKENLKDSFDGYIKSEMKDSTLIHTIGVVPSMSENSARILKRNLSHSLQIDLETGRDLLDEKGIDRLYTNKNSYLIFDKDIAEEISTVYDAKPIKVEKEETKSNNDTNPIEIENSKFSSPQILREKLRSSPSNIKDEKVNEKDVVLDIDVEYNEPAMERNVTKPNLNLNENSENSSYMYSGTQPYNFGGMGQSYQSNNLQGYSMFNRGNFGVNINDFNFKNDFGNYKIKIAQPLMKGYFLNNNLNNNFWNNFNNSGKIFKNNFHKLYETKGAIMNSNGNRFNTTNLDNGSNDMWVPVGQQNNQNIQRPYANGTVEFTAVPNQMLNTELNPLGTNTMIFNPYSMQNPNFQQQSNVSETIIQPIIQPIIQQVVQQPAPVAPKTTILEPIVNDPIMADGSSFNPYMDYSQLSTSSLNIPRKYDTGEFGFKNNNDYNTNSHQFNTGQNNFNTGQTGQNNFNTGQNNFSRPSQSQAQPMSRSNSPVVPVQRPIGRNDALEQRPMVRTGAPMRQTQQPVIKPSSPSAQSQQRMARNTAGPMPTTRPQGAQESGKPTSQLVRLRPKQGQEPIPRAGAVNGKKPKNKKKTL
ncbi:MAG: hypothetical protein ACRC1F_00620, partial [Metamycoplasmataceae bacterium]